MSSIIKKLFLDLEKGTKTDCTFVFTSSSKEITLKAHQVVLGTASPVFEAMFFGQLEKETKIKINDVSFETFLKLLE